MKARFQIRRWPDNCPPLIGEIAVVDTKHKDGIVKTYRSTTEAESDAKSWNENPPTLVPVFRPMPLIKERMPDGSIRCRAGRIEPRFYDESSYADYTYQFPTQPNPTTPVHDQRSQKS